MLCYQGVNTWGHLLDGGIYLTSSLAKAVRHCPATSLCRHRILLLSVATVGCPTCQFPHHPRTPSPCMYCTGCICCKVRCATLHHLAPHVIAAVDHLVPHLSHALRTFLFWTCTLQMYCSGRLCCKRAVLRGLRPSWASCHSGRRPS
jgi:hypothetical protein